MGHFGLFRGQIRKLRFRHFGSVVGEKALIRALWDPLILGKDGI